MVQTETQNDSDPFAGVTLATEPYNFFNDVTLATEPYDFSSETDVLSPALPEAGTYTQDDIAENDYAYSIAEGYMRDRYGNDFVDGKTRESIVDSFLNNRRGVVSGNSISGLAEIDYINDIKDDQDKKVRAAKAYQLYENMAGIFSKEATWSETGEGLMDFTRSVLLDPVNLVGGFLGKAVAGGSLRVGTKAAQKVALEAMKKQGTKEAAKKEVTKVFNKEVKKASVKTAANVAAYSKNVLGKTAAQRLATRAAITEIGVTTSVDAMIGAGMEYLYQTGMVKVEAQEEIDGMSVGIALLGGIILGGVQVGVIAKRGVSDTALPNLEIPEPKTEGFVSEVSKTIDAYVKQNKVEIGREWKTKVKGGAVLSNSSKDFGVEFVQRLLFGHADDEGNVILKGMTQVAYERGFVWAKRFEEDKFTNWMADLIAEVSDKEAQDLLRAIEKSTGNKLKVKDADNKLIPRSKVTGRDIGDILAYKMSEAGTTLGASGLSARQLGISLSDQELKDLFDSALDAGFVKDPKGKSKAELEEPGKFKKGLSITRESFASVQNRLIRLLVSHPSTSALNVIGWGANTALQSVSDISTALIYAGRGTLQKLSGEVEKGANTQRLAKILIESNAQRIKFLFDADMTYTAFESALQRNSEALQKLNSVLPGGVENTTKLLTEGNFSPSTKLAGLRTDQGIDLIQKLTFVQAQDSFTKSQEFLFQMDKKLRATTGKGWNEFYRSENIGDMTLQAYMATKNYRAIEASAVEDTLEAVFSKSYKSKGSLGTLAGLAENARNWPGLGMLIPFGRFFNNTVAFMGKNTPGLNMALKASGYYDNMSKTEAFSRSLVSLGILYTLTEQEIENVKNGLPMYATRDPITGEELISQQYDFPVSAYRGAARVLALWKMKRYEEFGKAYKQFSLDFGVSGVLRNLDRTQRDTLESLKLMIDPERRDVIKAMEIAKNTLATQYVNPLMRPLEPLNVVAGLTRGEDAAPIDRAQNNRMVNNAFRYIDNIIPLFTGKPLADPRETAAGGTSDIQSTKILGARVIRLTDTQRVMNSIGLRDFDLNTAKKIRDQAPEAANALNGIVFDIIEAESSLLLESSWWDNLTQQQKRDHWNDDVVKRSKELAKTFLRMQYSGPDEIISLQYDITSKYPKKDIQKATKELDLDGIEYLEQNELFILQQYLNTEQSLRDLSRFQKMTQ